ncbi:MAG: DUF1559 domain-containing protein [Armatimonadota bacterium]|nr:DUF1559 domain-containing protein [Armatimonadota bacterium]
MNHSFSQMSVPSGPPPPGYGTPPGYGMAPPPKKNNTATIVIIVVAVVFGGGIFLTAILAAILFPVFQKVRENARLASCESNVKQIDLGLMQYVQDHNEKYPPSASGFKATIFPYIQSETVFHCPTDTGGTVSYSFNQKLQGVSIDKLNAPANTVAVYEGKNQTLDFRHQHSGGDVAVIGFADGSVRTFSQAQAQSLRWKP